LGELLAYRTIIMANVTDLIVGDALKTAALRFTGEMRTKVLEE